jgi:dolichol-phosphate mannosyltransferase
MPQVAGQEADNLTCQCHLSVVTPAYNEAENLPGLIDEIVAALSVLDRPYEIIVVDDASTDQSAERLAEMMKEQTRLRVVRMKRRSGQSSALAAGLAHCRGRYVATLDADGQNDPADIPRMLAAVTSGTCDMVTGWRMQRNDTWLRRVSSRVANGVRNVLTREQVRDSACGHKVFRRECLDEIVYFDGMHRFLPTLVRMRGHRVTEMPVHHRARMAGRAKYGLFNRLVRPLADTLAVRWMQNRQIHRECEEWSR